MRIVFGGGVAGLAMLLFAPSSAAEKAIPSNVFAVPAQRANRSVAPRLARRRPSFVVTPQGCTTDYGGGIAGDYFVGVPLGNFAEGANAAVLGGSYNEACGGGSAIAGGSLNVISYEDVGQVTEASTIGGGYTNAITGAQDFVGSGAYNEAAGDSAFLGAGLYNYSGGDGSFVGAGGAAWYNRYPASPPGAVDNDADGTDSFVGGGDLNQISSAGNGSFIGGGGYEWATTGQTPTVNNQISGVDSFIGAGDQNAVNGNYGVIGGGYNNSLSSAAASSAIVGGNHNQATAQSAFVGLGGYNAANGTGSFVGAGFGDSAGGTGSFVGGGGSLFTGSSAPGMDSFVGAGDQNTVTGNESFIGGGQSNSVGAAATYAVVGGGKNNNATGVTSTIGGGSYNSAAGTHATVPGGYDNAATAQDSFAAGYEAKARNAGSFVWSDDASSSPVQSTKNDQFIARASGGYIFYSDTVGDGAQLIAGSGAWGSLSDRTRKSNIVPLDDAAILDKVAALPVSEWSYTAERGVRHVGPMAQDFYAAFGVGEDNRHITSIDEDGVALAAIKALHAENARLHDENARLSRKVEVGNALLSKKLEADDAKLRTRLALLEAKLDRLASRSAR
jgi:hypothetical protein